MTKKSNGCVGSYVVNGYTKSDGTVVSSYIRTCGAAHNSNSNASVSTIKRNLSDEEKMLRRAEILYPDMKYSKYGEMTGGAAPIGHAIRAYCSSNSKKKIYEYTINNIDKNFFVKYQVMREYGVETAENLLMSKSECYMNTDYAKENLIFNNYKEVSSDLRNYFKDKITRQLELNKVSFEEKEKILNSTKGIYINAQSDSPKRLSKVLLKEPAFMKLLTSSIKKMKNGLIVEGSLKFKDENFYNALGKADIKFMHINKQGNIDLLITDVYDFNPNSNSDLIKVGRKFQEQGKIIPYFIMYNVIIPKDMKVVQNGN